MDSVRITRKLAGTCDDDNCPTVWETTDPGLIAVTGDDIGGGGERTVLIPRPLWEGSAQGDE